MGVQVFSYFPQIANGGGAAQKWIPSFTFYNPHPYSSANTTMYFYNNAGLAMQLDLGSGPVAKFDFTVRAQSTVTFTSDGNPSRVQVGWAMATSSLPLQSVALYRYSVNGIPQQGGFRSCHAAAEDLVPDPSLHQSSLE
jgi:hypothetical protein